MENKLKSWSVSDLVAMADYITRYLEQSDDNTKILTAITDELLNRRRLLIESMNSLMP